MRRRVPVRSGPLQAGSYKSFRAWAFHKTVEFRFVEPPYASYLVGRNCSLLSPRIGGLTTGPKVIVFGVPRWCTTVPLSVGDPLLRSLIAVVTALTEDESFAYCVVVQVKAGLACGRLAEMAADFARESQVGQKDGVLIQKRFHRQFEGFVLDFAFHRRR